MARIFITGSTDGLGHAAARAFIDEGHEVVLHVRSRERTAALHDLAPRSAGVVTGDLSSAVQTRSVADQVNDRARVVRNLYAYFGQLSLRPLRRLCMRSGRSETPTLTAIAVYAIVARVRKNTRSVEAPPTPESFLPLPRDTFHILVSLADRDRHGYSVMKDVLERTGGALRLSPSSLYASIRRLLNKDLIEELDDRPDPAQDDERRRYYRLTSLGRAVASAEARRLERLLADARASGLLPRRA